MRPLLLFLLLTCGLCGCNMHTSAYRATDMGRVPDNDGIQISDLGGQVAYATEKGNSPGAANNVSTAATAMQTTLSEFSTEIKKGDNNRVANIEKAANALNNTIIKPGEVFSYNDKIGPAGKSSGFRLARIFIQGRDAKGYGGGICQVSSTLFQAVEKAGLEIIERHPHSKDVSYVGEGKDAATSYGGKDLKFKNNTNSDIMIVSKAENYRVTIKIMK